MNELRVTRGILAMIPEAWAIVDALAKSRSLHWSEAIEGLITESAAAAEEDEPIITSRGEGDE